MIRKIVIARSTRKVGRKFFFFCINTILIRLGDIDNLFLKMYYTATMAGSQIEGASRPDGGVAESERRRIAFYAFNQIVPTAVDNLKVSDGETRRIQIRGYRLKYSNPVRSRRAKPEFSISDDVNLRAGTLQTVFVPEDGGDTPVIKRSSHVLYSEDGLGGSSFDIGSRDLTVDEMESWY